MVCAQEHVHADILCFMVFFDVPETSKIAPRRRGIPASIENAVERAYPSPHLKQRLDRFDRFRRVHQCVKHTHTRTHARTHTHTRLMTLFEDYLGKPVPER